VPVERALGDVFVAVGVNPDEVAFGNKLTEFVVKVVEVVLTVEGGYLVVGLPQSEQLQ